MIATVEFFAEVECSKACWCMMCRWQQCVRGKERSLWGQEHGLKMWNLWVVYSGDLRREWRKLGCSGGSRTDNGNDGRLSGLLLSLGAVYPCDIPLVGQGWVPGQLVPMCCHFQGFLSIWWGIGVFLTVHDVGGPGFAPPQRIPLHW